MTKLDMTADDFAVLSYLKRWQNVVTHQSESVAEHTCQVALLTIKLHDYLLFDLGKALQIALLHDVQEVYLTDLPANVTKAFPAMAEAKRQAERQINADRLPKYASLLETDSLELKVVKLADTLQVVQFACSELRLAYNARMFSVYESAIVLAYSLAAELNLQLDEAGLLSYAL